MSLASGAEEAGKPQKRSQVLRNKFFAHKEAIQSTHPHITEWFDSNPGREIQTDLIHNCFTKNSNKSWKLELDKPYFKETKKRCVLVRASWEPIEF